MAVSLELHCRSAIAKEDVDAIVNKNTMESHTREYINSTL